MSLDIASCQGPNDTWRIDFKGHFKTSDGTRVYPLTVMDAFSRFLIRCELVLDPDAKSVTPIFESAFREFGLPRSIRSDNGPPYASKAPGGLTSLSAWWTRLGITREPLGGLLWARAARTLRRGFRSICDHERPHEALGQVTRDPTRP